MKGSKWWWWSLKLVVVEPKTRQTSENAKLPQATQPAESRVRKYLANERTYLAWMRTAIALMGFGVAIVRPRALQSPLASTPGSGWKLGLIFSLVGLATVILSTWHYFTSRYDIELDTYEPADRWVIAFSLAVTILGDDSSESEVHAAFSSPVKWH